MKRATQVERRTNETEISCQLVLDGRGQAQVKTGIGFLDHMLELMVFYAGFDMTLTVQGDLDVDGHHTVEDVGLVLGQSLKEALGDRQGISRYGWCLMPMDETMARTVVDISGRSVLVYDCSYDRLDLGKLDVQNIKEFFKSLVNQAGLTLHLAVLYGDNDHHKCEALFKGFGMAMRQAVDIKHDSVFSTKGVLS